MLPITDVRMKTVIRDGSRFRGFELVTSFESTCVYALIEDFRSCCEEYGSSIAIDGGREVTCRFRDGVDEHDIQYLRRTLVGHHILDVGWGEENRPGLKYEDPQTNKLDVRVRTISGTTVHLKLFNTHNGYYGHYTIVRWDGMCDDTNVL